MIRYCSECGDEYHEVEYRSAPVDSDEPEFCSSECEDAFQLSIEFESVYSEGRYGGASLH